MSVQLDYVNTLLVFLPVGEHTASITNITVLSGTPEQPQEGSAFIISSFLDLLIYM